LSNIDPTKPTEGQATTQSVRDNFAAAATEIDANVAAIAVNAADILTNAADIATNASDITDLQVADGNFVNIGGAQAPADLQLGVWVSATALEGAAELVFDDQAQLLSLNANVTVSNSDGTFSIVDNNVPPGDGNQKVSFETVSRVEGTIGYTGAARQLTVDSKFGDVILKSAGEIYSEVPHHFQSDAVIETSAPPASAGAAGVPGTIQWDTDFIYICVALNTWKRAALVTWP